MNAPICAGIMLIILAKSIILAAPRPFLPAGALKKRKGEPVKWHKGFFGFFAPVWVADPEGQCWIKPRHIGHFLFPLAEFLVQSANVLLSIMDARHPHGKGVGKNLCPPWGH